MKFSIPFTLFLIVAGSINTYFANENVTQSDWLYHARIATPYGYNLSWEEGLKRAIENNANVILDWAGFSDSYRGRVLQVNESLQEFKQRVEYVHSHYPNIKYMVYIAPLEMQTYNSDLNGDGKDDDGKDSTYTDHPDWLQVGIDGRKAVFYGSMPGMPFWVDETSEDVWLSPSNKEYRNFIMNLAKEIALTGVDAIWFDVPHLRFNFGDAWQNQWSSVDEASRNDFYNDTGLILPEPPIRPDWNNATWREFVLWRYKQINDFIKDFNKAMKGVNPECKLIIETSSNSVSITQNGCSLIELPYACDAIAHEYGGPFEEWQYYSWMHMLATLKFWHDFDINASWLLSYVEHGKVELARFHAALVLTMGFNYYTSGNIGMAGIVDEQFMHDFFEWLGNHDDYFYGWDGNTNIALLFSQQTLDFLDRGSWEGYAYHDEFLGITMMLIESNVPFEVISEKDLNQLDKYDVVILPDFACMSEEQADKIRQYVANGGTIIAINETSLYNEYGIKRNDFLLKDVFGVGINEVEDEKIYENEYNNGKAIFIITPVGRYYYWAAAPWGNYGNKIEAEYWRGKLLDMIGRINLFIPFEIDGNAVAFSYEKEDKKMIRILNFKNIGLGNAVPKEEEIEVKIYGSVNEAKVLDFMGNARSAEIKKEENTSIISFTLYTQCCLIYSTNESVLHASIVKPEEGKIYFMGREITSVPSDKVIIIGGISIETITNGNKVEFYVDDELKFIDEEEPYRWQWDERAIGKHEIKVIAYDNEGNKAKDEIEAIIFNIWG